MSKSLSNKFHKIKIFYKDNLISDEPIIRDYADFLIRHLFSASTSSTASSTPILSLHTGSKCFDIISIVVTFLKVAELAIAQNFNIEHLKPGDIVLHHILDDQTKRERWVGIKTNSEGDEVIITKEDADGINGELENEYIRETEEPNYAPYIGDSTTTGVTKLSIQNSTLNNFLGYVFNRDSRNIPILAHTIETIIDKAYFEDIVQNTTLVYANTNKIKLSDLVPFSYETKNGILHQIGPNSEKLNPVFVYTEKLAAARSHMFNNKDLPFTLLMLKDITNADTATDLDDFIDPNNSRVKQVLISTKMRSQASRYLLDQAMDLNIYTLSEEKTKTYLNTPTAHPNPITTELAQQLKQSISKHPVEEILIPGGLNSNDYRKIRQYAYNESFPEELKEKIKVNIFTLLKSLNTMCFSTNTLENSFTTLERAAHIKTPNQCLNELSQIAHEYPLDKTIIAKLTSAVNAIKAVNPKQAKLLELLLEHRSLPEILVVVEKAYYKEILTSVLSKYSNVKIVTPSELFKRATAPDLIIITSPLLNAKTDIYYFAASTRTIALLYENEQYLYKRQRIYHDSYLKKLSLRLKHSSVKSPEYQSIVKIENSAKQDIEDNLISLLDEISNYRKTNNIKYFQGENNTGAGGGYECTHIAVLSDGYQAAFSKNYSAAVYNPESGEVIEKNPEALEPGDKIIFMKNSSTKSSIIDFILHKLYQEKIFSPEFIKQYELAQVWKTALEEFRKSKNLTIAGLYYYFTKNTDKNFSYQTFLTWTRNSNIVGPKYPETLKTIGEIIGHSDLAQNYNQHYDAIRSVRSERLKIINLIGKVIKSNLSSQQSSELSNHEIFEAIKNNIDELSVILEVEEITKLTPPQLFNINYINKPIYIES